MTEQMNLQLVQELYADFGRGDGHAMVTEANVTGMVPNRFDNRIRAKTAARALNRTNHQTASTDLHLAGAWPSATARHERLRAAPARLTPSSAEGIVVSS